MKMAGPYSWIPPAYWYADKLGGAFGFDSEVSAGASIPLLDDLTRMLSPQELEALWKYPQARQFHASAAWSIFATLEPFDTALAKRYGPPKSLEDYVAKSQLENYDNVRAQFEAFNAHMDAAKPSTGVIYWMLNNAWPSLHWHLYDYFLNPAGAYFGAKIANEPVHIQYSYDTRAIMLVNHTLTREHGLRAVIRVRNLDGSVPTSGASGHRSCGKRCAATGDAAGAGWLVAHLLHRARARLGRRQIDQPQRLLALHPNRRARLGTFELVPNARDAIRGPDRLAVLADRDERGPGNDAARGSRGHRHGHSDGTPILQGRGAVPARVDQAIRGRRAAAADPVERQ
jgi:hypothetical protein